MPPASPPDKRHFRRIPFDARVTLYGAGIELGARLLDVSLKGALVELEARHGIGVGERCRLEIALGAEQRIHMEVSVAHVEGERVGCRCDRIDLDSITHLARLVELNTGDPDLLQRELGALGDVSSRR